MNVNDFKGSGSGNDVTEITFGLVTLNEERTIGASLGAIICESEAYPKSEIIVVAAGTDRTIEIVKSQLRRAKNSKLFEEGDPKGKPVALNLLLSVARGEKIILSDGDVTISKGSIAELLKPFSDHSIGCVSGHVIGMPCEYTPIQEVCRLMNDVMHLSRARDYTRAGTIELASGYLIAVRRGLVTDIPSNVNSDDGYISRSVRSRNKRIAYAENALVEIRFPVTISDFVNQKVRTRLGHLQLRRLFDGNPRNIITEIRDFLLTIRSISVKDYGLVTLLGAMVLSASVWIIAYARRHLPFLFAGKAWIPVKSTK